MVLSRIKKIEGLDLFNLHDPEKDVKPRSWICAGGDRLKNKFIDLIIEVSTSCQLSKSAIFRLIAKNLNCSFSNIKRVVYRKKIIPLPVMSEFLNLWAVYLNKSDVELLDKKKDLQDSFEILKSNFSLAKPMRAVKKLSIDLAKICGAHAADGWIGVRKRRNGYLSYDFALREKDKKAVLAFKNWVESEFGLNSIINNRSQGCYSIEFSNKIFLRYLHLFFDFPYGKKSNIVKEPSIIKNSSLEFRKAFALGVMTFDGGMCKKNIQFTTKSKALRDSIFEVLNLDGIKGVYVTASHDKLERWKLYSSKSKRNKEFISWLDYFEKGTDKYDRLSNLIITNNAI
jgi:hypothetical protein